MKYQIDSQRVDDYLVFMEDKIEEFEEIITLLEDEKEKLEWEGKGADASKDKCQEIINKERDFCNILRIYMLIYKKGLESFGTTLEELEKEFKELLEEKNLLKKVVI